LTQIYDAATGKHTLSKSSSTQAIAHLVDIQKNRQPALSKQQQQLMTLPQSMKTAQMGQQQQISYLMQQLAASGTSYAP